MHKNFAFCKYPGDFLVRYMLDVVCLNGTITAKFKVTEKNIILS